MNLVADEGIDREIVDRLRQGGHRVSYVAEMKPGLSDDEVLTLANREASLLLTSDRDFGELVFRQHRLTFGVVLLRLTGLSSGAKATTVASAITAHAEELLQAFTVIRPGDIRVRSGAHRDRGAH